MTGEATGKATEKATAKKGFHYAFAIVACGIMITCVPCALVISCAGIYFTPVAEYFGVAKVQFSMYFSILSIAMMVFLPFAGKLMASVDLRIVLSAAVLFDGLSMLAMSQFTAVWMFYIAGVFLGLGTAPLIYLAIPTLINAWCQKRIGFFVGLCMAFSGIGGVIFNPIGTALINSGPEGWRLGYLVFGVVILVATLPFTLFVVRSKPEDKGLLPYGAEEAGAENEAGAAPESAVEVRGPMAAQATKTFAFALVAVFSFFITLNMNMYQFIPSYVLSYEASAPEIAALSGVVASACMLGQAIGKVVLGTVSDKSVVAGSILAVACGIAGVLLMWLLGANAILLLAGAFLFGFVYTGTTVLNPMLTTVVFGNRDYSNIYSRVSTASALGSVLSSTMWGVIVDLPNGFAIMFILSIAMMLLCLASSTFAVRKTLV